MRGSKRSGVQPPVSAAPPLPQVDQPAEPMAAAHQTHFWLTDEDVEVLDWWVFQLRRGGWRGVSRSACIRALLEAIRDRPVQLTGIAGEEDFAAALKNAFDQRAVGE